MAKKRDSQAEQTLCIRLLEYSDECLSRLRSTLAESIERASLNVPEAFVPLGNLCLQLADRAKSGVTSSTSCSHLDIMRPLPSAVDLCFTYRDSKDLVRKLNAAAQAASRWRPVDQRTQERPAIVLGDHEETIEQWEQDAAREKNQSDRVAEQNSRGSIVKAMDGVFAALTLHQASIREQLRSVEHKPGKSRGWTQNTLDEAIRKLRQASDAKVESLRRSILSGDKTAVREARSLFGRNSLSRKLDAPKAMISHSTEWQELADHLGLPRGRRTAGGIKVGFDMAVERDSVARHDRAESVTSMLDQLQERVPSEILDAVREQLKEGEITYEEALQSLNEYLIGGENDGGNDDRS